MAPTAELEAAARIPVAPIAWLGTDEEALSGSPSPKTDTASQMNYDDRHMRPSYAAGIILIFFVCSCGFAASQEAIVLTPGFKPLHRSFLTLVHSTAYVLFSAIELGMDGWTPAQRVVPLRSYLLVSVFCFFAVLLGNRSLSHIEYSTRVMFKCAKPLPTMLLCGYMQTNSYSALEYGGVVLLGLGLATCIVGGSSSSGGNVAPTFDPGALAGFALAIGAICAESIISTYEQIHIFGKHRNVLPAELLMYTYAFTAVGALVAFAASSEPRYALNFFASNPNVLLAVGTSEIFGYASISCVVRLIATIGAAPAEVAKTARKGMTFVLAYAVLEDKPLGLAHAKGGLLFAFGTALSVLGHRRRAKPVRSPPREIKEYEL